MRLLSLLLLLVFQRYSLSLVYKPSLITRNVCSRLLCRTFSGELRKDGSVAINEKGVRKWEPRDPLALKERTNERLSNNLPQIQQTQSATYRKNSPRDFIEQQGTFASQFEVDKFIENNLGKCKRKDISDFFRLSAKVSKRNRKVSFLTKHLPLIAIQLRELSNSE